eukprot:359090-Chlamydomonas_euryale.AAC.2
MRAHAFHFGRVSIEVLLPVRLKSLHSSPSPQDMLHFRTPPAAGVPLRHGVHRPGAARLAAVHQDMGGPGPGQSGARGVFRTSGVHLQVRSRPFCDGRCLTRG